MSYDLAILDGTLVMPGQGLRPASIGIRDGQIAAIFSPAERPSAQRTIDAQGLFVFPGVIESHAHLCTGQGFEDLTIETSAAALGGVTSILFFLRHPEPYDLLYEQTLDEGKRRSCIDFGLHITLITEQHLTMIPRYVAEWGIRSFKFYMTYRGDDARAVDFDGQLKAFPDLTDGFMLRCMEEVAKQQCCVLALHAENIELIQDRRRVLREAGRQDMNAWQASRPRIAEIEAVRRAIAFVKETRAKVIFFHVTTRDSLVEIQQAKIAGLPVHAEVCHPYLSFFDGGELDRRFKMRPPLRPKNDVDGLWSFLKSGVVDTVGSDHVPRPLEAKLGELWQLGAGAAETPLLLPALLSEGYHKRGIPLWRIAELISLRPAQIYGLYPQKGQIAIGADADFTLVDLDATKEIKGNDLGSHAGYSLYDGQSLKGWPTHTIVRGKVVVDTGVLGDQAGWGRYIVEDGVADQPTVKRRTQRIPGGA